MPFSGSAISGFTSSGRLFAVLGQQMLTVAVGWELYERTGSPLALGLVGLAEMIAMVCCTLPAGHLADNFNRKRIILTALLFSSSASLGLAFISWRHAPVVTGFTPACSSPAMARTFLWPASSAFLTSLVPRELFPRAVTWNSGAFQLSSVAGPALGGALYRAAEKIFRPPGGVHLPHQFLHGHDLFPLHEIGPRASRREQSRTDVAQELCDRVPVHFRATAHPRHDHAGHVRRVPRRRDGAAAGFCQGHL